MFELISREGTIVKEMEMKMNSFEQRRSSKLIK